MKQHLFFHLKPSSTIDEAFNELREWHLSDLYLIEDKTTLSTCIGAWGEKPSTCIFHHVLFKGFGEDTINWEAQWSAFSPAFREGLVHITFNPSDQENAVDPLFLIPGAVFGDLSHPTTRLILELMPAYSKGSTVIDIGCGSGILTLAAIRFGASYAIGLDIDKTAIHHARENASLNNLTQKTVFSIELDETYLNSSPLLILMNMISSEQMDAWNAHGVLHHLPAVIITSGILPSERKRYLAHTKKWNWHCIAEREESGWLGFCFIYRSNSTIGISTDVKVHAV